MKKLLLISLFLIGSAFSLDTMVVADSVTGVASRTSSPSLSSLSMATANFNEFVPVVAVEDVGSVLPTANKIVTFNISGTNYHLLLRSI